MTASLYERIGGERAVRTVVMKMYEKVLTDNELAPFFEDIGIDRLRLSQMAFVTFAFGGTTAYGGRNLRLAHRNAVEQGLSDRHFDLVVHYLTQAMREQGIEQPLIEEAARVVEATRADVLNR